MTELLNDAALVCIVLGVLSAVAVLARERDLRLAIAVLLEFLLASGLLRLSADATARAVLIAAAIVALRRLVAYGLGVAPPARVRGASS